ncbi:MAG: hypothetical protein ACQESF_06795, partial [Nanobdellota archaeon]
ERIESLHAMVQSGIIGLFIYSAAGFIIMILGKNKVLNLDITMIVSATSLIIVLPTMISFFIINRKAFK